MSKTTERDKQVQETIDNLCPDMQNSLLHEFFGIYDKLESGELKTIDEVKTYVGNIIEMCL